MAKLCSQCVKYLIQLLVFSLGLALFAPHFGYAQEDDLGGGESSAKFEPPPVTGMQEGSAIANQLLDPEEGVNRKRSPWGASFFDWATVNIQNAAEGEGRLETYNYFSFEYRLDWKTKLSLRPEFYLSGPGNDFMDRKADSEIEMGDIYLQYTNNQLAMIPSAAGDMDMAGSFRVYYPNSKQNKLEREITHLQARLRFDLPLGGNTWLIYHFRPAYFMQSRKTYVNEFFNVKATENYRLEQILELKKILSGSRFALSQEVGLENRKYYGSAANNLNERVDGYLGMSTSVSWRVQNVNLKGGLSWETKVGDSRSTKPYDFADTKYYLMSLVFL